MINITYYVTLYCMRVAALLSGGVDSSVALYLLLRAGYSVDAYYLKVWSEKDVLFAGSCPWEEDLYYAQTVCRELGVRLTVIPLQQQYYERVVQYTLDELRRGATPSPDLMCNAHIKFDAFMGEIDSSYHRVASGHYASTTRYRGHTYLSLAKDRRKDQSYFLARVSEAQLKRIIFPLAGSKKINTRALAGKARLATAGRPDSQGLCFLGAVPYPGFIRHYLGERRGEIIVRDTGACVGEHKGHWFYTIGQRQGLGLASGPWYVVDKDAGANAVYVSRQPNSYAIKNIYLGDITWNNAGVGDRIFRTAEGARPARVRVKYRHSPQLYRARLTRARAPGAKEERVRVAFENPVERIAPGQQAALYQGRGGRCIGCGRIETAE